MRFGISIALWNLRYPLQTTRERWLVWNAEKALQSFSSSKGLLQNMNILIVVSIYLLEVICHATPINLQENGNAHAHDLMNSRYLPGYHTTRFQRKSAYARARLVNVKPDEELKRILLEWPILHSVEKIWTDEISLV